MPRPGTVWGLLVALAAACASEAGSEGRPLGSGAAGGSMGGAGAAGGSTGGSSGSNGAAGGSTGGIGGASGTAGSSSGSGGAAGGSGGTAAGDASAGSGGAAPDAGGAGGADAAAGATGDAAAGLGEGADCYGAGCAAGLFCDGAYDYCGSRGVCSARPLDCSAATPAPVCACDGRVHASACAAHLAGVDLGAGCAEADFPPGQFSCGPYFCDPATSYCHQGRGDLWDIWFECRPLPAACSPGPATCACLTLMALATCSAKRENGVDFLFVDELYQ